MNSDDFDNSRESDDLGNEELREYLEELQRLRRQRERLDDVRKQNERLLRIKQISERLREAAEFAQKIVDSVKFKQEFCRLYNLSITQTTLDISEIAMAITLSAQLSPVIAALIIVALTKARGRLKEYCSQFK